MSPLLAEERPDVLLLDLMMPDRGGFSLLVAVREDSHLAALPVVIVSGIQQTLTADYHAFLGRFSTTTRTHTSTSRSMPGNSSRRWTI